MIVKIVCNGKSLNTYGRYCLNYKLGEVTHKIEGSIGIFCYDTDVEELSPSLLLIDGVKFFEVEGIGEPVTEFDMSCAGSLKDLDMWYEDKHSSININEKDGYVLYDAVLLIREVDKKELNLIKSE